MNKRKNSHAQNILNYILALWWIILPVTIINSIFMASWLVVGIPMLGLKLLTTPKKENVQSPEFLNNLKDNIDGAFRYVDDEVKNEKGRQYIPFWKMMIQDQFRKIEKLYQENGKTEEVSRLYKKLMNNIISDPDKLSMGEKPTGISSFEDRKSVV